MKIRDLSEDQLLARILPHLPRGPRTVVGPGDDCAVVAVPEGRIIVTTDVLMDVLDFCRTWSLPQQVGARVVAQNLADIAGMGGRAIAVLSAVVVPPDTDVEWLQGVVDGVAQAVEATGAGMVGGDLSGGEQFSIGLTVIGVCDQEPVLRSGAQPGDVLAIAGTLGFSGTGLELLAGGHIDGTWHGDQLPDLLRSYVETYRVPTPPLQAGPLAAQAGAHAMMDVSDGLVMDANRVARASHVDIELDHDQLTFFVDRIRAGADVAGMDPWHLVLTGGEDHPMMAAFDPTTSLPAGFHAIGRVVQASNAEQPQVRLGGHVLSHGGFDHFRHECN